MSKISSQMSELVQKLLERTKSRALRWEQLSTLQVYQARHGNFLLQIRGSDSPLSGTELQVSRLDGTKVATCTNNPLYTQINISDSIKLSAEDGNKLQEIYKFISDKSSDLDELITSL